jgi:hypothetical protein
MPRKPASAIAIERIVHIKDRRPRLAPSPEAPPEVVEVFGEIVRAAPAEHFRAGDAPLIEGYAQAIVLSRQATTALAAEGPVVAGRTNPWLVCQEKSHRAIAALSARLRLSPQHRADSRSAMRKADGPPRSIYAMMDEADDDGT